MDKYTEILLVICFLSSPIKIDCWDFQYLYPMNFNVPKQS